MKMYPANFKPQKKIPLQSILFGHRVMDRQTKNEYLIEFLQVAISHKKNILTEEEYDDLFPIDENKMNGSIQYYPKSRIGLKRFIFFPNSKLDGKAQIDKDAYKACYSCLANQVNASNSVMKQNSIMVVQNLLNGFSAVNQSRSWFDQNMLPICPEVILPEGMGVKSWRQNLKFSVDKEEVDSKFDFHRYTYMCRGGEVYYLHVLNAINSYPEFKDNIEKRINELLGSFPQFSYLCNFVQNTWEDYKSTEASDSSDSKVSKDIGAIPLGFENANYKTLTELNNFLNSKAHPFEKMESFSNGIILQLLRVMYNVASDETNKCCWVIDVNSKGYENPELKKLSILSFKRNEEIISKYLYRGLDEYKNELAETDETKIIKDAADSSYRLFRKMGKMIGLVIPAKGPGMRFSLSEDVIKFIVLAVIPPKNMVTLDEFMEILYEHYRMVIGPQQYKKEMEQHNVVEIGDFSCLEENKKAFTQKLKECGFLRDLSDATSIVENPYEEANNE